MKNSGRLMKPVTFLWLALAVIPVMAAISPSQALAQLPARFYLKSLSGGSAVPLIVESISGNTNPFDPAHNVTAGANFDATMALAGYAFAFSLYDRAALAAVIIPMGRISGDVKVGGISVKETARGFGDPMLEFDINLIGPLAQKNIPDVLRYEPGFSLDLLFDLAIPVGEYDSDQSLNIGQNRWYGRVGMPVIWQLGQWVPGRRTTLELLPSVWFYGDNTDFQGKTLKTDPSLQLDAHLTRDLTEHFWGSIDGVYYKGGKSSVDGVSGESVSKVGVGLTLGYQINDNLNLTVGYKSTVNDSADDDLKMDVFMVSLVYGWHPLVEGMKRLSGEK
jgi:hypothetical protein